MLSYTFVYIIFCNITLAYIVTYSRPIYILSYTFVYIIFCNITLAYIVTYSRHIIYNYAMFFTI